MSIDLRARVDGEQAPVEAGRQLLAALRSKTHTSISQEPGYVGD